MAYTQYMGTVQRVCFVVTLLATLVGVCPVEGADGVEVAFSNGRVTLGAQDVTVRDILAEWAAAGHTQFIDVDDLMPVPMRLHLIDVPEADALRLLLRNAAGFVAAPRAVAVTGVSTFDRVMIMASSQRAPSMPPSVLPSADAAPRLTPVQGTSVRAVPEPNPNFSYRAGGADMEELREILPQPLQTNPARGSSPNNVDSSRPVFPSRPGILVAPTDKQPSDVQVPTFIRRPVRPQNDNPDR